MIMSSTQADEEDEEEDVNINEGRLCLSSSRWSKFMFSIKYWLYVNTPVGRTFHSKQITAWKNSGAKPHCEGIDCPVLCVYVWVYVCVEFLVLILLIIFPFVSS